MKKQEEVSVGGPLYRNLTRRMEPKSSVATPRVTERFLWGENKCWERGYSPILPDLQGGWEFRKEWKPRLHESVTEPIILSSIVPGSAEHWATMEKKISAPRAERSQMPALLAACWPSSSCPQVPRGLPAGPWPLELSWAGPCVAQSQGTWTDNGILTLLCVQRDCDLTRYMQHALHYISLIATARLGKPGRVEDLSVLLSPLYFPCWSRWLSTFEISWWCLQNEINDTSDPHSLISPFNHIWRDVFVSKDSSYLFVFV